MDSALRYAGYSHSVDHVLEKVRQGKAQMWAGSESVGITEVIQYPQKKVCRIWLAAGDMDELKAMEPDVAQWARENGCSELTIEGRKGWAKVWKSYSTRCVELVKEL